MAYKAHCDTSACAAASKLAPMIHMHGCQQVSNASRQHEHCCSDLIEAYVPVLLMAYLLTAKTWWQGLLHSVLLHEVLEASHLHEGKFSKGCPSHEMGNNLVLLCNISSFKVLCTMPNIHHCDVYASHTNGKTYAVRASIIH